MLLYPAARDFACLRIVRTVADGGRKAGYRLAGFRLGRTGFAPAGRLITFQKGLTSSHSREPAFLPGRTDSLPVG